MKYKTFLIYEKLKTKTRSAKLFGETTTLLVYFVIAEKRRKLLIYIVSFQKKSHSSEKTTVHNSDIACWSTEKTKSEKTHNAKNSKRGAYRLFENPACIKISKIMKGEILETSKHFRNEKQNMRVLKSQFQKNMKGDPLGFINISSVAKCLKN